MHMTCLECDTKEKVSCVLSRRTLNIHNAKSILITITIILTEYSVCRRSAPHVF